MQGNFVTYSINNMQVQKVRSHIWQHGLKPLFHNPIGTLTHVTELGSRIDAILGKMSKSSQTSFISFQSRAAL